MHDRIALTGIRARGRHGVFDFERRDGQDFVVDVTLMLDLSEAARRDDLTATVDYGGLAQEIVDEIAGEPVDLIETLAGRIAARCLTNPLVHEVEVTVHKPTAPLSVDFTDVAVTVRRSAHP